MNNRLIPPLSIMREILNDGNGRDMEPR